MGSPASAVVGAHEATHLVAGWSRPEATSVRYACAPSLLCPTPVPLPAPMLSPAAARVPLPCGAAPRCVVPPHTPGTRGCWLCVRLGVHIAVGLRALHVPRRAARAGAVAAPPAAATLCMLPPPPAPPTPPPAPPRHAAITAGVQPAVAVGLAAAVPVLCLWRVRPGGGAGDWHLPAPQADARRHVSGGCGRLPATQCVVACIIARWRYCLL